jgi:hypothetical protein
MYMAAHHAQNASDKSVNRRFKLLQKMGLFSPDTQGAKIYRAVTLEDLEAAYRLTHDVFVSQGYIHPDFSGLRIRPFEALENSATFIAKVDSEVVGVTTVVLDSPEFGLPSDVSFKAEIDGLRSKGRKVCEGTNWLVADSHRNSAVITELMRCSYAYAYNHAYDDFLGAVSPGHGKFYELLGFDKIGAERSYSDKILDPVVLMRVDVVDRFPDPEPADPVEDFLKRYYLDENPYHKYMEAWQILSDRLFADTTMMRVLFEGDSGFLGRCDVETLEKIRNRWGADRFDAVYPEGVRRQADQPSHA